MKLHFIDDLLVVRLLRDLSIDSVRFVNLVHFINSVPFIDPLFFVNSVYFNQSNLTILILIDVIIKLCFISFRILALIVLIYLIFN
jgi:hypothetical protein